MSFPVNVNPVPFEPKRALGVADTSAINDGAGFFFQEQVV